MNGTLVVAMVLHEGTGTCVLIKALGWFIHLGLNTSFILFIKNFVGENQKRHYLFYN